MIEDDAILLGIRIVERPLADEAADRLAQAAIGNGALVFIARFRVLRHLREHPDQGVRDVLFFCRRRCFYEVYHGVGRHSLRGVEHEAAALILVATHLEETRQRLRLKRAEHARDATLQRRRLVDRPARAPAFELVGDLQHVADDDLVVGLLALMLLDRPRDHRRLERSRVVIRRRRVRGERRPGQANPELRRASQTHLILGRLRRVIVEQLETVVGERVQAHVVPLPRQLVRHQTQRTRHSPRVHRQRR